MTNSEFYPESDYLSADALAALGNKVRDAAFLAGEKEYKHGNGGALNGFDRTQYDGIPQLFMDFTASDPKAAQPMVNSLWQTAYALNQQILTVVLHDKLGDPVPVSASQSTATVDQRVNDLNNRLTSWTGNAKSRFDSNFVAVLVRQEPPLSQAAMALALTLEAQQQLVLAAHNNLRATANATINVLDALGNSTTGNDAAVTLTVFTAAVGVLTAIPSAGLSALSAASLISATIGLAEATAPLVTIHGKTVNSILDTMYHTMVQIRTGIGQQEDQVSGYLTKAEKQIQPRLVPPPRPTDMTKLRGASVSTLTAATPDNALSFYD